MLTRVSIRHEWQHLPPHKNLGAIIGGARNTIYVMISLSLKLGLNCFVIVSDNMNEDTESTIKNDHNAYYIIRGA